MTTEGIIKTINDALETAKAVGAKGVWQREGEGWKYVLSLHGLLCEGVPVVHTKFIVWTENDKDVLAKQAFTYLYDLNCIYHTRRFVDEKELAEQVKRVVVAAQFGKSLRDLSEIMVAGQSKINKELSALDEVRESVMDLRYTPAEAVTPCAEQAFDFVLNVGEAYDMALRVRKAGDGWHLTLSGGDARDETVIDDVVDLPRAVAAQINKLLRSGY